MTPFSAFQEVKPPGNLGCLCLPLGATACRGSVGSRGFLGHVVRDSGPHSCLVRGQQHLVSFSESSHSFSPVCLCSEQGLLGIKGPSPAQQAWVPQKTELEAKLGAGALLGVGVSFQARRVRGKGKEGKQTSASLSVVRKEAGRSVMRHVCS